MAENTSGYDFWNSALGKALKAVKKGVLSLWSSVKRGVKKLFTRSSLTNKNSSVVSTAPLVTKSPQKPVSNPSVESNRSALETIEFPDHPFVLTKKKSEQVDLHFKQTLKAMDDFLKDYKPQNKPEKQQLEERLKDQAFLKEAHAMILSNPNVLSQEYCDQLNTHLRKTQESYAEKMPFFFGKSFIYNLKALITIHKYKALGVEDSNLTFKALQLYRQINDGVLGLSDKIDTFAKEVEDFEAKKSLKPVEKAITLPLSMPVSKHQKPEILASSHAHQEAQAPTSLNTVQNAPLLNQPLAGTPLDLKPSVVTPLISFEVAKKPGNEKEVLKLKFEKTLRAGNELVQACFRLPGIESDPAQNPRFQTVLEARNFIRETQTFILSDKTDLSPEFYTSVKAILKRHRIIFRAELKQAESKNAPYLRSYLALAYDQRLFKSLVCQIKLFSATQALNSLPPENVPSSLKTSALALEAELKGKNSNFLSEGLIDKINQLMQDVDALSTKRSPGIKS